MPKKNETKHDAFIRLMERRLERALEEFRLIKQMSARNYEWTQVEAEEAIGHLDAGVRSVAHTFKVPYSSAIGKAARRLGKTGHLITGGRNSTAVDGVDIAKALELMQKGQNEDAYELLKNLLLKKAA